MQPITYPETAEIEKILGSAQKILILQADNPDGDSMGSALALEQILGELGKDTFLYCGVDVPSYLSYLEGWDRIEKELPHDFDVSIIVDTSAASLFENLSKTNDWNRLRTKPCIVIDHHASKSTIPFATIVCNYPAVSTGEVIYELALQLQWNCNLTAKEMISVSIMADSMGLITEATSARSISIMADLVENGVSLADLEHARRLLMRKTPELTHYKGELLQRIEYYSENRIATVHIPWPEIVEYSPLYNPSMLVIDDMRMTTGTEVAIAFKTYADSRITAKIRANQNSPIAATLAEHFGGGGHKYAAGFKIDDGTSFEDVRTECIRHTTELLNTLERDKGHNWRI